MLGLVLSGRVASGRLAVSTDSGEGMDVVTWRLFAAVVPPAEVIEKLDHFLEPRRDADPALRWTLPASWHLTCAFMPAVPESVSDQLADSLGGALAGFGGFEVTLGEAGVFPDPDRAKVLWLGVSGGADQLTRLAAKCRGAATRAGVEVDRARFRPHLTLARANGVPMLRWLRVLAALEPISWPVTDMHLIRSFTLPGGAGYRTVARFPLAG